MKKLVINRDYLSLPNLLALSALLIAQLAILYFISFELYEALVVELLVVALLGVILKPELSIFLLGFITFFPEGRDVEQFVLFHLLGFNWYLMDIVFIISMIGFCVKFYRSGVPQLKKVGFHYLLLWFLLVCLWSTYRGFTGGNSPQAAFFDLRSFFYYLSFFPVLYFFWASPKYVKYFLVFILGVGTLKSGIDVYQSLFVYPHLYDVENHKYLPFARLIGYSEIIYPLTFVGSILFGLVSKDIYEKIFITPSIFLSGIALYLSYTRGSWLSAVIALVIMIFILGYYGKLKIKLKSATYFAISTAVLLGLLDFLGFVKVDIIVSRAMSVGVDKIDISNLARLVEYATALEAFNQNPLNGAGFGFSYSYFAPGVGYMSTNFCHNSYLYVLSKMGLVGIVPFTLLVLVSIKAFMKTLKNIDEEYFKSTVCFMSFLLLLAIKSFTTWHLNTGTFSLFVGLLFGVSIMLANKTEEILDRENKVFS